MKKRIGPSDILFPVPAALVVSGAMPDPNVMTVAWIGVMGSSPPVVSISLKNDRFSLELIREHGDFTVNIPPADKYIEVDYCGIVSGRERKKLSDINFTAVESSAVRAPIIAECPFNLECRVIREIELNKWTAILGEILETHVDEDKIDAAGKMDISAIDPLVYCARVREYWRLGEKLGDGFSAGRKIKERLAKERG